MARNTASTKKKMQPVKSKLYSATDGRLSMYASGKNTGNLPLAYVVLVYIILFVVLLMGLITIVK